VALKILEISLRENHVAISRFEREAKLLSKLDHPGIVPFYSYGESQGLRYLVMKAIPKENCQIRNKDPAREFNHRTPKAVDIVCSRLRLKSERTG
jgi:serine/threonine protein kinase